uniref:Putative tick transposon n=1 Tax=Rhipicephalus microplus TaxID=6941 RepID=A0A6M2D7Q5_RHIMP
MRKQWQEEWNAAIENKLHTVKPRIGRFAPEKRNRHQEVALCRLGIGHTHATHSHLLSNSPALCCEKCVNVLSGVHVLIMCLYVEPQRLHHFPKLYKCHILPHPLFFFGDDPMFPIKVVLKFLADVGFLHLITYSH